MHDHARLMANTILISVFPTVVAAGQAYLVGRHMTVWQHRRQMVADAMTQMLQALSTAAQYMGNPDPTQTLTALALMTQAKAAVTIYGSPRLVAALAGFQRAGLQLTDSSGITTFLEVLIQARREAGLRPIDRDDLLLLVIGR